MTFAKDATPPVNGFWSLTLYNEHHFFVPNDLNRYSLGTKNKDLVIRRRFAHPLRAGRRAAAGAARQLAAGAAGRRFLALPAGLLAPGGDRRRLLDAAGGSTSRDPWNGEKRSR